MEKLSDSDLQLLTNYGKDCEVMYLFGGVVQKLPGIDTSEIALDLLQTRKELAEANVDIAGYEESCEILTDQYNVAMSELTALREATRWIPVSERLPETDNMAYDYEPATKKLDVIRLLSSMEDQASKYDRGYLFRDGCWRNESGNMIYVNYWKEILPQPPEGGQK